MDKIDDVSSVSATFYTIVDVMKAEFIHSFIDIIEKYAGAFKITGYHVVDKVRPRPLDRDYISEVLWKRDVKGLTLPWIFFVGPKPYHSELSISVGDGKVINNRYNMTAITIRICKNYFKDEEGEITQSVNTFLSFCKDIYYLCKPLCGRCHDDEDKEAISISLSKRGFFRFFGFAYSMEIACVEQPDIDCPITGIYWANFFGPSCVKFYGREKLTGAPGVVGLEGLDDGGVIMFTAPHPLTPNNIQHRKNQLSLWGHLGLKPIPSIKTLDKYYSSDRYKDALSTYERR